MRLLDDNAESVNCILNAVAVLMHRVDYDRITVRDVLREANVSRSTFYRHFSSVDDAVETLEDRFLDAIRDINRVGLLTDVRDGVGATSTLMARLGLLQENALAVTALLGPHSNPRFRKKENEVQYDYYRSKVSRANLTDEELDLYLTFIVEGNNGILMRWLSEYSDLEVEVVVDLANKMAYSPIVDRIG